jgi:mannose-1-phosphate guanylyltransferase/mannose-6-phosphate isomerase
MEPAPNVVMVPFEGAWNDVGSWTALQSLDRADSEGNVLVGDVLALESRDCYLRAESRLLATVGLENLLVVETADAVLVAHRDRAQDVRRVVQELSDRGRSEHLNHARVLRPWGSYECISGAERFQVKRIVVKPGHSLSLQMHHHRAEHWVVVRGTAKVTRGADTLLLTEDQSTYIPLGTVHRLENPGSIPLEIIEVQSGSYLGEDDIVRFEDAYGRGPSNT